MRKKTKIFLYAILVIMLGFLLMAIYNLSFDVTFWSGRERIFPPICGSLFFIVMIIIHYSKKGFFIDEKSMKHYLKKIGMVSYYTGMNQYNEEETRRRVDKKLYEEIFDNSLHPIKSST